MTKYIIQGIVPSAYVIADEGTIIEARFDPEWVGRSMVEFSLFNKDCGYELIPVLDAPVDKFSYRGTEYEIKWNAERSAILRIVARHEDGTAEDIPFSKLPSILKGVL